MILRKKSLKTKFTVGTAVIMAFLIIYAIILYYMLFWAIITSFKIDTDFMNNVLGFPKKWYWHYSYVFTKFSVQVISDLGYRPVYMYEMYLNSVLYSLGCAATATITPCITAYLCAKFKYKFSTFIYVTVIVVMVVPIVGSQPSEVQIVTSLNLYDKIWGLWILKANFLGLYFLVFYSTFKMLPNGFTEAAKIDGAGNTQILFKIILPLVKTTIFTVILINFINFWNDYSIPMIYIPNHPTIAQGMFFFAFDTDNEISNVPMRMTGAAMMAIPIIVLFIAFHKRLVGNLRVGGIKG